MKPTPYVVRYRVPGTDGRVDDGVMRERNAVEAHHTAKSLRRAARFPAGAERLGEWFVIVEPA